MARLITKHDVLHVHKTLGLACLLHFLYRYAWVWPTTGSLGLSISDLLLVCMHWLLSVSSLVFKVPLTRTLRQPTTIWKEYQLHAILFTSRCVVAFLLFPGTSALLRYVLVMPLHVAADFVSEHFGVQGNTTVRGDHTKKRGPLLQRMILTYGLYQHFALASHLVPNARGRDLGWNAMIAIQSSAFGMTLVRKGVFKWHHHAVSYTICIAVSALYIVQQLSYWQSICAVMAYAARRYGVNKYGLWLVVSLLHTLWARTA